MLRLDWIIRRISVVVLLWPLLATAQRDNGQAVLRCEAVYLPERTVWTRTVDIGYDQRRVRSVGIDGVKVYSFHVQGTWIFTALDNERIQINTATLAWTSDFRGLATSEGRCDWLQPG